MATPAHTNLIRRIHRVALDSRRRTASLGACAVALTAVALVAPTTASATPSSPAPNTTSTSSTPTSAAGVQAQLLAMTQKNSQVVEAYDQAQVLVGKTTSQARAAGVAAARATAAYARAQQELSATIAMEYETGAFSATGALLSSDSGQSYLNSINTLSAVSAHSAQVVQTAVAAKTAAAKAESAAKAALAKATGARDQLSRQKAAVEAQITKLRTTLASLTAAQRTAYYQVSNPAVAAASIPNIPAPNARAAIAVAFAKAQVGKPYVFGAAGPGSYDCSGLTMASWAAAGVALPHSAAQQYSYGTHIPESALQPGDLVFMYSPIGHVTIYIGGGLLVSAPQPGQDVSIVPLSAFQNVYAGATRLS